MKAGKFDVEIGKLVARNFEARQSAGYDMDAHITEEQARELLDGARTFYALTIDYFKQNPLNA